MYEFDELIPYIKLAQRVKDRYYYRKGTNADQEADEFQLWVMKKPAQDQAKRNLDHMLELAKENDFAYLVAGNKGIQFISIGEHHRVDMEKRASRVMDEKYFADLNEVYSKQKNSWGNIDCYWHTNTNKTSSFAKLNDWKLGTHFTKELLGVYNVATGERIKGREKLLTLFWDLGCLTRRGRVLEAAGHHLGSPEDVRTYHRIKGMVSHLDYASPIRVQLLTGIRKITRWCDYPVSRAQVSEI